VRINIERSCNLVEHTLLPPGATRTTVCSGNCTANTCISGGLYEETAVFYPGEYAPPQGCTSSLLILLCISTDLAEIESLGGEIGH